MKKTTNPKPGRIVCVPTLVRSQNLINTITYQEF